MCDWRVSQTGKSPRLGLKGVCLAKRTIPVIHGAGFVLCKSLVLLPMAVTPSSDTEPVIQGFVTVPAVDGTRDGGHGVCAPEQSLTAEELTYRNTFSRLKLTVNPGINQVRAITFQNLGFSFF